MATVAIYRMSAQNKPILCYTTKLNVSIFNDFCDLITKATREMEHFYLQSLERSLVFVKKTLYINKNSFKRKIIIWISKLSIQVKRTVLVWRREISLIIGYAFCAFWIYEPLKNYFFQSERRSLNDLWYRISNSWERVPYILLLGVQHEVVSRISM